MLSRAGGVPGVIRDDTTDSWGYLAPGKLLPNYLNEVGYHTALIGKWHLGLELPNLPNERGFRYFYGFLEGMMDNYTTKRRNGRNYLRQNHRPIDPPGHATDVFTEEAIRYLTQRKADKSPFFLYLPYTAPHDPLQPPNTFLERVQQRQPGIDPTRAKLVALIEHMDDAVGRVLAALRANGQLANTLIIFTSDNGGWGPGKANNGPYRGVKGQLYEGGIRIPAGAMWAGRIRPGQVSDTRLLLMDWFPTLLRAAGISQQPTIGGRSFLPLLTNIPGATETERPLFFVRREGKDTYKGQQIYAVQFNGWKLLQPTPFAPYELYNLTIHPGEMTNLAQAETAQRDVLISRLMEHIRRGGATPWQR